MPVLKRDNAKRIEELSKALKALQFSQKLNGNLSAEEVSQLEEIEEALEGYKVLEALYGDKKLEQKLENSPETTPKRGPKTHGMLITEFPLEYSVKLKPLQKVYAAVAILGEANKEEIKKKIQELDPDSFPEDKLRKLIENKTGILVVKNKLIPIDNPGQRRRFKIRKEAEAS